MNILRKIGVSLCAALLSLCLFGLAWSHVGITTIHNKDTVKGWLDESGFYSKIADVALEKIKAGDENKTGSPADKSAGESLPIDDPQVQAIAKSAFSPEFLKSNVEKFLDGSYDWLNGTSENLSFSLDLTTAKQQLATGLGDYTTTKAASLPACATNEPIDAFDAFSSVCRPKGLTPEAAGQGVASKLASNEEFLANPVLSSSDIKVKDSNGNEVPLDSTQQAEVAQKVYKLSGLVPLMFAVVSLLSAAGILFLSLSKLAGLRKVGYVLLVTGVVLLATYLALGALSDMATERLGQDVKAGSVAQNKLAADVVRVIATSVQKALVTYTAAYIALGVAVIVTGIVLKKRRGGDKKPGQEVSVENENLTDEKVSVESPRLTQPPKPIAKPRPKKLQF